MRTTIFYKTNNSTGWQMMKLQQTKEECENLCKRYYNFSDYKIMDMEQTTPSELHLLTDIVFFEGKYYFPEDKIAYPTTEPKIMKDFQVSMRWEGKSEIDSTDYDEVYNKQGINWGWGHLWTNVITKFSVNENMDELGVVAQGFIANFSPFLEKLEKEGQAVYHNDEYSPFKWLAWIKNNSVRLIHQDYRDEVVQIEFDILVDKDWFLHFGYNMIKTMQEYADSDFTRYKKYVEEKYKVK